MDNVIILTPGPRIVQMPLPDVEPVIIEARRRRSFTIGGMHPAWFIGRAALAFAVGMLAAATIPTIIALLSAFAP